MAARFGENPNSPVVKIGITSNLRKRSESNNSSNPLKLQYYRVFAFEDIDTARRVEINSIKYLKSKYKNVSGRRELFFCFPSNATEFILNFCRQNHLTFLGRWPTNNEDRIELLKSAYGMDYRIIDIFSEHERNLFEAGISHAFHIISDLANFGAIDKRFIDLPSALHAFPETDMWRRAIDVLSHSGLIDPKRALMDSMRKMSDQRMFEWMEESNEE